MVWYGLIFDFFSPNLHDARPSPRWALPPTLGPPCAHGAWPHIFVVLEAYYSFLHGEGWLTWLRLRGSKHVKTTRMDFVLLILISSQTKPNKGWDSHNQGLKKGRRETGKPPENWNCCCQRQLSKMWINHTWLRQKFPEQTRRRLTQTWPDIAEKKQRESSTPSRLTWPETWAAAHPFSFSDRHVTERRPQQRLEEMVDMWPENYTV